MRGLETRCQVVARRRASRCFPAPISHRFRESSTEWAALKWPEGWTTATAPTGRLELSEGRTNHAPLTRARLRTSVPPSKTFWNVLPVAPRVPSLMDYVAVPARLPEVSMVHAGQRCVHPFGHRPGSGSDGQISHRHSKAVAAPPFRRKVAAPRDLCQGFALRAGRLDHRATYRLGRNQERLRHFCRPEGSAKHLCIGGRG